MAKIVMICCRYDFQEQEIIKKIELLSKKIIPDNIQPSKTEIIKNNRIIFGIFNPNESYNIKENRSIYLGSLYEDALWWEPKINYPDGSYALFRSNNDHIEILSDAVASRTIWYYKDKNVFLASTSQRAIIYLLGSFNFNEQIIPWMLSAGNLGPGYSWDKRIKCMEADSALLLKRSSWELHNKVNKYDFLPLDISESEHLKLMGQAVESTFKEIKIDFSRWVIPLSGGYDSRYILSMLKDKKGISTITWGSSQLRNQKGNDAYVAKLVAEKYGINNLYFELDLNEDEIRKIFDYFLICSEGRIDHLFGYTDRFEMWKELFENKVKGIIRGDVCFSNQVVLSENDVRFKIGFPLCNDFSNLINYRDFGFPGQVWPEFFRMKKEESLQTWRDRIYQQLRIPVVLAALSDLKLSYVEIINPFLSKKIIYQSRKLPEHLRAGKTLFKELAVSKDISGIGYAKYTSYTDRENILKLKTFVDFLKDELDSFLRGSVLPADFLKYVLSNITIEDKNKSSSNALLKDVLKTLMPLRLRNKLKNKLEEIKKPTLDFNTLAFRCYIICKMNEIFNKDVKESSILNID